MTVQVGQTQESLKYFPSVRTSQIEFRDFDEKRIRNSLMKETGLSAEKAEEISQEVRSKIVRMGLSFLSAPLIRELVCVTLLEKGLETERTRYTRLGLPVFDVTNMMINGDNENANLQHNPETIHKLSADAVFSQYALLCALTPTLADAHISGAIHIHELEYFVTRPFCQEHDLRFFLKRGLVVDGQGVHTSVAGPAKHPEVAILHAAKALAAAQTNWAGGQGYDFFNVWLAPYVRGLSYSKMKQLAQMYIYEMSQMYVARGGQTVFSSIALEPTVPRIAADLPAVLPGGKVGPDRYGDYAEEANSFFNAIMDVYLDGDSKGKPFNFPKPEVKLRREYIDKFDKEYLKVSELAARHGSPYLLNLCPDYMPDIVNSQCCRIILTPDSDEEDDFREGKVRMGSLGMVTINLPRISYESNGNDRLFFELLGERMALAKKTLEIKREIIQKRMLGGTLPFATMDCDGEPYLKLEKQVLNIGFIGLNEALKAHTGEELHETQSAWRFGLEIISHMVKRAEEFSQTTGLRFGCLQTPAESTCHRLALIDFRAYPDKAVVQGDPSNGGMYYTNSSHVRPSADVPFADRVKIEASFHPLTRGGAILHVFLGERYPDKEALLALTRRIATKTLTAYFAYTKDMTICTKCSKVEPGLLSKCPNCGAVDPEIEWWSRITGYYQRVKGWNAGKRAELLQRHRYGTGTGLNPLS